MKESDQWREGIKNLEEIQHPTPGWYSDGTGDSMVATGTSNLLTMEGNQCSGAGIWAAENLPVCASRLDRGADTPYRGIYCGVYGTMTGEFTGAYGQPSAVL
jgi:hypothetical protein